MYSKDNRSIIMGLEIMDWPIYDEFKMLAIINLLKFIISKNGQTIINRRSNISFIIYFCKTIINIFIAEKLFVLIFI